MFVVSAFERLLSRAPSASETEECTRALEKLEKLLAPEKPPAASPSARARASLVHVLLNHNDFLSIR